MRLNLRRISGWPGRKKRTAYAIRFLRYVRVLLAGAGYKQLFQKSRGFRRLVGTV
jgi:hypothetical protein